MFKAGNDVLITTKPYLATLTKTVSALWKYKEKIQYRITITSIDDFTLEIWEKNTPRFKDRFLSLQLANDFGYKTNVSTEPLLNNYVKSNNFFEGDLYK
ncbi:MAG: hypothetical protein EAX91_12830 [Candidatus Lokiarchaeota archaeon]|nr:hypothetical protein [Candidatus Lokiarchaeota archaeon]